MAKTPLPTPELLRKLLRYEPDTGKLIWMVRDVSLFNEGSHSAKHTCSRWNSHYAGKDAFTAMCSSGYKQGSIFGKRHMAHRVIWAMVHGEWLDNQIDHINHDRCDNRIINLRSVSHKENHRNKTLQSNNTSGHVGVSWHTAGGKWQANIQVGEKLKHLGIFTKKEDAIAARAAANTEYGFHENHGK